MYQEFPSEQVVELEKFIESPEFDALRELPPWQRAYGVARHLGQSGTETSFGLLLNSLWYESEEFLGNTTSVDQFISESEAELLRADAESKPFINAIVAYALSAIGRFDEANEKLNSASNSPDVPEYLHQYIAAIKACQKNMGSDGCRPHDRFDP